MKKPWADEGELKSDFVGFGSGGVFGDIGLMSFEIVSYVLNFWVLQWDLAEDGESSAYAAFVCNVFEFWVFVVYIITHLVGESDNIKLAMIEIFS